MLWMVEAILLAEAAKTGDVRLASMQIILNIFGFISFGLDGFAHTAEAMVGDRQGKRAFWDMKVVIWRSTLLAFCIAVVISAALYFFQSPILTLITNQHALIETTGALWLYVTILPLVSFLAFQMDGVFVGATRSDEMRNGMVVALGSFVLGLSMFPDTGLDAVLAPFIFYLGTRGIFLLIRLPCLFTSR